MTIELVVNTEYIKVFQSIINILISITAVVFLIVASRILRKYKSKKDEVL